MCSILFNNYKVNKNLISIIREYLLPHLDDNKSLYSTTLKSYMKKIYPTFYLQNQCFLNKMKRRFPQKHYNIIYDNFLSYSYIKFSIENLKNIRNKDPIFTDNKKIDLHIISNIYKNEIDFILY